MDVLWRLPFSYGLDEFLCVQFLSMKFMPYEVQVWEVSMRLCAYNFQYVQLIAMQTKVMQ